MKNKRRATMAVWVAALVTMAAMTPSQAAQTNCGSNCFASAVPGVQDRGMRVAAPVGATVVAWEAGALRSGR
jgi:hypothetical protein